MELKDLYALMEKFEKSGLSELGYKKDGTEISLKKPSATPSYGPPAYQTAPEMHPAPSEAPQAGSGTELIRAPLVGTFYRAPAPDAPPFAEKGDMIKKGKPICILEAMKLMNEIETEVAGRVMKVMVENGEPVEFGQALFLVEPA